MFEYQIKYTEKGRDLNISAEGIGRIAASYCRGKGYFVVEPDKQTADSITFLTNKGLQRKHLIGLAEVVRKGFSLSDVNIELSPESENTSLEQQTIDMAEKYVGEGRRPVDRRILNRLINR